MAGKPDHKAGTIAALGRMITVRKVVRAADIAAVASVCGDHPARLLRDPRDESGDIGKQHLAYAPRTRIPLLHEAAIILFGKLLIKDTKTGPLEPDTADTRLAAPAIHAAETAVAAIAIRAMLAFIAAVDIDSRVTIAAAVRPDAEHVVRA